MAVVGGTLRIKTVCSSPTSTPSSNVVEQLKTTGRVSRGWLGVLIQDVTRELAETFGMKQPKGALVAQVLDDSPAKKAGLQVGDVILSFNGRDVATSGSLPRPSSFAFLARE